MKGFVMLVCEWLFFHLIFWIAELYRKKYYEKKILEVKEQRMKSSLIRQKIKKLNSIRRMQRKCGRFMKYQAILFVILSISISVSGSVLEIREKTDIPAYISKNDKVKTLEEIFAVDDVPNKEEVFKEKLHFSWITEESLTSNSLKSYEDKVAGIIFRIPDLLDKEYESLTTKEKAIINKYAFEVMMLDGKKEERLTLEEYEQERQYYMEINKILPSAERIFQMARSSEDAFWICIENSLGYITCLEKAADSISEFEEYARYENRYYSEIGEQECVVEAIFFRMGKTYYSLGELALTDKEKRHYYMCAYACFANAITREQKNNYLLLSHYYRALAIDKLLGFVSDEEIYEELVSLGLASCEMIEEIYHLVVQNDEDEMGIIVEKDMEKKINDLNMRYEILQR